MSGTVNKGRVTDLPNPDVPVIKRSRFSTIGSLLVQKLMTVGKSMKLTVVEDIKKLYTVMRRGMSLISTSVTLIVVLTLFLSFLLARAVT